MWGYFWGLFSSLSFWSLCPDFFHLVLWGLCPSPKTQRTYLLLYPGLFFLLPWDLSESEDTGNSLRQIFSSGVQIAQYLVSRSYGWTGGLIGWCICWLGRCGSLTGCCGFCFLGLEGGKPIPLCSWKTELNIYPPRVMSLSLFGLVRDTRLHLPAAVALGLRWYDLLAKGVVTICLHLRNSDIFFCNGGKGLTLVPQGLHIITWVLLSFL